MHRLISYGVRPAEVNVSPIHGAYGMPKDCMYLAENQRISTDPENILIRSIAQKVSKSASKGKEKAKAADKGKRVADDNGNSSAPKRPRDEAGPSGRPFAYTAGVPLLQWPVAIQSGVFSCLIMGVIMIAASCLERLYGCDPAILFIDPPILFSVQVAGTSTCQATCTKLIDGVRACNIA